LAYAKTGEALGLVKRTTHVPPAWTLHEFYDRYAQQIQRDRSVSRNTWINAEQWALKHVLAFRGPDVPLTDLTEDWIAAYEAATKSTFSPYTWNSRRATLRAIGNRAVAWKWLAVNPFQGLNRAKTVRKRPKRLDQEQLPILLKAMPRYWQLVTLLFYATGLRLSEACALQKRDIRWAQGYLNIESNKENRPKSIAITPEIATTLKALEAFTAASPSVLNRHPGSVKNYYHKLSQRIGFKVSPHRFRHSHGTHRIEAGDNLKAVSDTLGHADIRTTADYYLELNLTAQRAAMSHLPIKKLLKSLAKP